MCVLGAGGREQGNKENKKIREKRLKKKPISGLIGETYNLNSEALRKRIEKRRRNYDRNFNFQKFQNQRM